MRAGYRVVLDACVLIPMPLADTLLRMAEAPRLYLPKWSQMIMDQVARNLIAKWEMAPGAPACGPGATARGKINDPRHRRQLETLRADLDRFFERSGAPPIEDWRKNLRQKFDDYSR